MSPFHAPACASVPLPAVQGRPANEPMTVMGTSLFSTLPQSWSARLYAMMRCWPTVVPGLPPTGVAGVGSLKPTPGPSRLMRIMSAAWAGTTEATPSRAPAQSALKDFFMGLFLREVLRGGGVLVAVADHQLAARVARGDEAVEVL